MSGTGTGAGLGGRVARSAAWIVSARFVMRAFGFINTIVLARLLAPDDFGVVAVATAAMQLLQGLTDFGLSQAVIKFRDGGRSALNALFSLAAARGVAIAALLLAIAPAAADFYDDPRIFWVFSGVALYPLLTGFINPAFYEFERDMELSREFISSALNKLVGVLVSIAVAVAFRSYWAIILGLAASGAVQLVLSYVMRPYLPRFTFAGARELYSFSGALFGVSVITALNNKLDTFIVARALGPAETGQYSVGCQIAELPTSEVAEPLARALYPGLSALQGAPQRVSEAYLRGVEALAALALPASFGFAFIAADVTPLLLGEQWSPMIPLVQLVTPMLGFQAMFLATYYYALALGRANLIVWRELIYFILRFPIFAYVVFAYGFTGVIYASAGLGFIRVALNIWVWRRASGRPILEPFRRAWRSLGSVAAMSSYFLLVRPEIEALAQAPAPMRLGADIAAGALVYALTHGLLWRAAGAPAGVESALADTAARLLRRLRGA
jgi:PST family polysaccharide transporter